MSKSAVKEATGFAFFVLVDSDNLIECNDPCHNFVPIDEIADPSIFEAFTEVDTDDEPEIVEEMPVVKPIFEIFELKEIDICGNCDGLILAASVDAETGIIFFQKEAQPSFKERSLVVEEEQPYYANDVADEDYSYYPKKIRGSREYSFDPWDGAQEKRGWKKPRRNNRKTLPDRKIQRANRGLLGQVKVRCVEEDDFYEVATLLSYSIFDSIFSSMEFYDEEFGEEICA